MALGRLSVMKDDLLLNEPETTYDDSFKLLLEAATVEVNEYCNRRLESSTITDEYYSGDDRTLLYLNEEPVTALSAVSIWDTGTETYVSESTSYMQLLKDERGISFHVRYPKLGQEDDAEYGAWPIGDENIKVTYIAGYITTSWDTLAMTASFGVPADLEWAVCTMAVLKWLEGKGASGGGGRLGVKGVEVTGQEFLIQRFNKGMTPEVKTVLDGYIRRSY